MQGAYSPMSLSSSLGHEFVMLVLWMYWRAPKVWRVMTKVKRRQQEELFAS
jgi:hypothetical protein